MRSLIGVFSFVILCASVRDQFSDGQKLTPQNLISSAITLDQFSGSGLMTPSDVDQVRKQFPDGQNVAPQNLIGSVSPRDQFSGVRESTPQNLIAGIPTPECKTGDALTAPQTLPPRES